MPLNKDFEELLHHLNSVHAKDLSVEDLMNPRMVYQMGIEPNRIDILMGIGRISFDQVWKNRRSRKYGREKIYLPHPKQLIRTKKEAGRPQDQIDVDLLTQVTRKRKR